MQRLKDEARNWEPIAGVPWRDMPDEEFAAVSAEYDAHFAPDQAGSLARWFEHVPEPAPADASVSRATRDTKAKPASGQEG
jgi:hypothetical protein